MKKRILSLILCACLVLSICPVLNIAPAVNVHAATATYELYDSTNTDNFFTHSMSGSGSSSGAVTVNGEERTFATRYKLTKSLTITLGSAAAGTLTVVWKGNNRTVSVGGQSVQVTGNTVKCETITLNAGTGNHTITGASGDIYIWYIGFTPDGSSSGGGTTDCTHESTNVTHVPDADSTCVKEGNLEYWYCDSCKTYFKNAEYTEAYEENAWVVAKKTDHTWGETGVVTAPTCGAAGYTTYTCTVEGCGETKQETGEAATGNHSWNAETGLCTVCNTPCSHSYGADDVCTICGYTKPACTHANKTATAAKDATCKAEGNKAYWYCAECGTYFSDEACTVVTTVKDMTLDVDTVNGHSWGTGVETTAPTCQTEGVMTYTCSLCGETKTEAIAVDDTAHSWEDGDIITPASCIADGERKQTCDCGATQTVTIPAGHTYNDEGKCIYEGDVLLNCGAVKGSKYIHNITADGMTDQDEFFAIAGDQDSTDLATVIYNGETLTSAIKMNKSLNISFTVPTNEAEGDDYDGIVILVGSESRMKADGKTFIITTLKIAVSDGTTTTEYTIAVPSDGIIMFAVTNGYTYTITKVDGENPLYYFEYVPGANLATVNDSETGGESGGESGGEGDTTTGDGFVTFVAEIGSTQYLSLDAAVKAAQPGDTICLLKNTTEAVTVGDILAVGDSITIHLHDFTTGTITPAEGCTSTTSKNADDGTDVITITRTEAVAEHECTDENGDGKCDGCGEKLPVAYLDADKDDAFDEGEVTYTTVDAALAAALNSGDIVRMLRNSDETGTFLVVRNSVTLDLNGFQLTASGLSAFNGNHVIDSSETTSGLLVVPRANLILPQNNEELPVWNESNGYFFVTPQTGNTDSATYQYFDSKYTGKFKFKFRPYFGTINGDQVVRDIYLGNGGADNGLTISLRISWTGSDGSSTVTQTFVYTDEMFAGAYAEGSKEVFYAAIQETNLTSMSVCVVIISDTGVEYVGDAMTWTAATEAAG